MFGWKESKFSVFQIQKDLRKLSTGYKLKFFDKTYSNIEQIQIFNSTTPLTKPHLAMQYESSVYLTLTVYLIIINCYTER